MVLLSKKFVPSENTPGDVTIVVGRSTLRRASYPIHHLRGEMIAFGNVHSSVSFSEDIMVPNGIDDPMLGELLRLQSVYMYGRG